ncbi:MAG: ATP-binding protein [Candidatus Omnitrophota bacterium]
MTIRGKLILAFVLVFLLFCVGAFISLKIIEKMLIDTIGYESKLLANQALDQIDQTIQRRIEDCKILAINTEAQNALRESNRQFEQYGDIQAYIDQKDKEWMSFPSSELSPFMEDILSNKVSDNLKKRTEFYKREYSFNLIGEIFITNKYGANVAQTNRTSDYRQDDESWWQQARSDGIFVSDVEYDESSDVQAVSICLRIDSDEGEFLGVMKAVLNIQQVKDILKNLEGEEKFQVHGVARTEFKVLTKDYRFVYSSENYPLGSRLQEEAIRNIEKNIKDTSAYWIDQTELSQEGVQELASFAQSDGFLDYKGLGWVLVAERKTKEILAPVRQVRDTLILLLFLSGFILLLIVIAFYRMITIPLGKLTMAATKIGEGDLDIHIESFSKGEIGTLARVINEMTRKLKTAYEGLEEKVKERTVQLRASEEQLKKTNTSLVHREQQTRVLYEVMKMAAQTDSVEEAIYGCVGTICRLTSWPIGHVYVLSEDKARELKSSKIWFIKDGQDQDFIAEFKRVTEEISFAPGIGLPGRIWQSGEPAWIHNVQEDDNFPRKNLCKNIKIKGAFGFPIKDHGKTIAIAEFFTNEKMERNEDLLLTVRGIGEQLGRVIERQQADKELKSAEAQLLQSEKMAAVGQLAAGIAHEIKNPLAVILLGAEGLRGAPDSLNAQAKMRIDMIEKAAQRANGVIMKLLDFSRQSESKIELLNICQVMDNSIGFADNRAKFKNIDLQRNYEPEIIFFEGDRILLEQAFVNLLTNAIDAVQDRGRVLAHIYLQSSAQAGISGNKNLVVEITDNGCGMPPEVLSKIFEPFFTTKGQGEGTGLGLSIVYKIIEHHNGKISVKSQEGQGTTFTILLPMRQKEEK